MTANHIIGDPLEESRRRVSKGVNADPIIQNFFLHRSVRGVRIRASLLALQTVLAISLSTAAPAQTLRITSARRAYLLRSSTEASNLILIGTVEDTTAFLDSNGRPHSRYDIRAQQILKGELSPGDTIHLAQPCGSTPTRSTFEFDGGDCYDYQLGQDYLFMLVQCADTTDVFQIAGYMLAAVTAGYATVVDPNYVVSTEALLDSIRTFLAPASLTYQRDNSDAVISGTIRSSTDARREIASPYFADTLSVEVNDVLQQTTGPPIESGEVLTVEVRQLGTAEGAVSGVRPLIKVGEDGLLFLQYAEDHWAIGKSIYSYWFHRGEEAVVRGYPWPCGYRSTVAAENWQAIMSSLRQ